MILVLDYLVCLLHIIIVFMITYDGLVSVSKDVSFNHTTMLQEHWHFNEQWNAISGGDMTSAMKNIRGICPVACLSIQGSMSRSVMKPIVFIVGKRNLFVVMALRWSIALW